MPLTHDATHADEQLVHYLLGLLPEEERERLDEASVVDDETVFRLRNVEDDLVDAYVLGGLEGPIRERFESHYLSSPRRRRNVRFARRFRSAVDGAAARQMAPLAVHATGGAVPLAVTRPARSRSRWVWPLASAAAVLLACGLLMFGFVAIHNGYDVQREAAVTQKSARQRTGRLDQQPAANAPATSGRDRLLARSGTTAMAIVLLPQTRAPGRVPVITLSAAHEDVAMELRLESDEFPQYRAILKDPRTARTVWRSRVVKAGSTGGRSFVPVAVPAPLLSSQHYSVDVEGLTVNGRVETVGSYVFEVVRQ